jgi:uncharacterized SAM-binding protein YcdF (DUF218 family)
MFFILSKTLGYFCYPLSLTFLGLLLFLALRKRRPWAAWICFWVASLGLYFCSTPLGSEPLLAPLERPYRDLPPPAQADVILVLGGALDLGGSTPGHPEYGPAADRFIYALLLAKQQPHATVVFAGGTADLFDDSKTEASLLAAQAAEFGLAPERLRTDDRSRNTHENALEAKRILSEVGGSSVVVITSAFHMRRALGCLRKAGVEAAPYAVDFRGHGDRSSLLSVVPEASRLGESTAAIREYVGLEVYRLQGYL